MWNILLILFVTLLCIALVYSLRFEPLIVALAVATYGLKQIVSVALPVLQIYDTIFNLVIAGMVIVLFVQKLLTQTLYGCRYRPSINALALVWIFLGLFWVSILWSPFSGGNSLRFFPYYVIYLLMLPFLIGNPDQMIRAFRILWIILLVGCLGLLLSPYLEASSNLGRMVIKFQLGALEEGNPLALADTGVLLLLTSFMMIFYSGQKDNDRKIIKLMQLSIALIGVGTGFWIASIASRGETMAGIISVCFFVLLYKSKSLKQKTTIMTSFFLILFVGAIIAFTLISDYYQELSPRYSRESLSEGSDIRKNLVENAIRMGLSSPQTSLVGVGARGCEERLGMYPHSNLVQAMSETGIIGFLLLCSCYFLTFRSGFRSLSLAKKQTNREVALFVSFILSLLLYDLIVENKKGSLIFVDTYMWLAIAIFSFDRAKASLRCGNQC